MRTKGQLFLSWAWGKQGEDRLLTLQKKAGILESDLD